MTVIEVVFVAVINNVFGEMLHRAQLQLITPWQCYFHASFVHL